MGKARIDHQTNARARYTLTDDLGWYVTSNQQRQMCGQNLNGIVTDQMLHRGRSSISPHSVFQLTLCLIT